METTLTVWKLVVFSVILSTGASDYNVCKISPTVTLPVVHMCTDDNTTETEDFLIDAFALATTATTCNCMLHATSSVQIGTNVVIAPDAPCTSELDINTEDIIKYTCGYGTGYKSRKFGPGDISIQLRTEVSNKNATYCMDIVKSAGTGTLSIRCFSPYNNATSTTTPTTNDGPQTGTTTSVIPSPNSEHQQKPSSNIPVSPTPDTTHIGTTTPVIENKPSSEHQQGSGSFSVAGAVAIGAVGVLLIEAVLVSIVVVYRRMMRRRTCRTSTGDGVEYVNGNANMSSVDNNADNNYDELQQTNHPSSGDQEHVYIQVTGETGSLTVESQTSEQGQYVNMGTRT